MAKPFLLYTECVEKVLHSDKGGWGKGILLPPPSPRHNNAESKKQAQKSVRFLHSYACSGSGHSISPRGTQEIPPSIVSAGERCPGSSQRQGRIPSSPGRAHPGQGWLPAAHRVPCATGIKNAVSWRVADGWITPAVPLARWGPSSELSQSNPHRSQLSETATFGHHRWEAAA